MSSNHQPAILAAMRQPDFYPHPVRAVTCRETHISTVFLTGPFVYKVKKPVDLGFLDFSSIDRREHCCRSEVTLNRRLSADVYLDVLPIICRDGRYALGGPGEVVEYAVRMRQLADADAMAQRLEQGTLEPAMMTALVTRLVDFHNRAAAEIDPADAGSLAWQENLAQVTALAPGILDRQAVAFVDAAMQAFYRQCQGLFRRRRQVHRIRDVHGDLRCDHIYFTAEGIRIIDCIEFSRSLRVMDTICDLAFLIMDLTARHFPDRAWWLLREYVDRIDDLQALPLIDFYCCYRALVRCKVSCLRIQAQNLSPAAAGALRAAACSYLALARGYAEAFSRPRLWLVCGLPASGKSTIAAALADLFGIKTIRSDAVRKELYPVPVENPATAPFAEARYASQATERTYLEIMARADEALKTGRSVILDATFSRSVWRAQALKLAARRQAQPVWVECRVAETIMADRLARREHEPTLSDARLIHLEAFKRRFDPVAPPESVIHVVVDTARPPADCLRRIVLDARLWTMVPGQKGIPCSIESSSQPISSPDPTPR